MFVDTDTCTDTDINTRLPVLHTDTHTQTDIYMHYTQTHTCTDGAHTACATHTQAHTHTAAAAVAFSLPLHSSLLNFDLKLRDRRVRVKKESQGEMLHEQYLNLPVLI